MYKGSFVLPKTMLISIPNPLATGTWLKSFNFHERKKEKKLSERAAAKFGSGVLSY